MLLASSRPHDDFSINGLIDRIKLRPMNFLCHRGVPTEAAVDACVAVLFGRILRVEGDIGRRLSFVGQTVSWTGVQGTPPCDADCEKRNMIRNYAELSVRIKKLIHIHI